MSPCRCEREKFMEEKIINEKESKIIYREGDKLIKTYDESFTVSQVLNEALNQAKIEEAGICAPKVYEVKMHNGRLGIVMEYIDGENLGTLIDKNEKDIDKYIDILVETHHRLFTKDAVPLNNSYGRIKNKIFASTLPENIKYGLFYKLREIEFSRDIIHGDFTFSNIMIDKNDKVFLLDWSHAAFGDKKFDIAVAYALFDIKGRQKIGEKYLEKICELENVKKEQVLDMLLLAYVYVVDRFNEDTQKEIYKKIQNIIDTVSV